jgi:GAF domain-containing protein
MPSGRYAADTYGRRMMERYRAGKRAIFRDTRTDPSFAPEERDAHIAIQILAAVGVPLVKEGQLVAILALHNREPRNWTEEEIALIEETAERTWAAVERARTVPAERTNRLISFVGPLTKGREGHECVRIPSPHPPRSGQQT